MKRKKPVNKPKNSTKNEPWYKRVTKVQYIIAVALLIILLLVGNYIYEQIKLRNSIAEAGKNLDTLKSQIDKTEINGKPSRSEFCYHTGRKYSPEPIYCTQRLKIDAQNITDSEILRDFTLLGNIINDQENLNFVDNNTLKSFREYGDIFELFFPSDKKGPANCRIVFSAKGSQYHVEDERNSYEVDIKCSAGEFNSFLYPPLKN